MFLADELVLDDKSRKQMTRSELNARVTYSRFWKMKRSKPTTTSTFNALQSFPAP